MNRVLRTILVGVFYFSGAFSLPSFSDSTGAINMIKMTTSVGESDLELYPDAAPETVKNFVSYVESGHFDGIIFHRVIPGFMVQGGGFTSDMKQKNTQAPIKNEADNGLKNVKGTLSMARTNDPNSATSQFFINLVDNGFLDFTAKTARGWGYAVFAKVINGMEVVEQIAATPTGKKAGHSDVPLEPIVIEKAVMVSDQ